MADHLATAIVANRKSLSAPMRWTAGQGSAETSRLVRGFAETGDFSNPPAGYHAVHQPGRADQADRRAGRPAAPAHVQGTDRQRARRLLTPPAGPARSRSRSADPTPTSSPTRATASPARRRSRRAVHRSTDRWSARKYPPQAGARCARQRIARRCRLRRGFARAPSRVITRGKRVVLRPRRVGPTEIVSVSDAPETIGTTLIVTLGPTIPRDDELIYLWAGRRSTSPSTPRRRLLRTPAVATLARSRRLRRDADADRAGHRDGAAGRRACSTAAAERKAGRLAAPFGKNRLARSMTDDEAAALLASMQATRAGGEAHRALSDRRRCVRSR